MKKYLIFALLFSFFGMVSSQVPNSVAIDDTLFIKMGETITFNPLLNDYDPDGDNIKISLVSSNDVDIISFTDSTITFKIPDYFIYGADNEEMPTIYYRHDLEFYPMGSASIHLDQLLKIDTLNCNQIKTNVKF